MNSCVPAALVGRLGSAELGAVGLSSLIFNLSNFLFNFLLIVTTPKIAAAVARSDTEAVRARHHFILSLPPSGTISKPDLPSHPRLHITVVIYATQITTPASARAIPEWTTLVNQLSVHVAQMHRYEATLSPHVCIFSFCQCKVISPLLYS